MSRYQRYRPPAVSQRAIRNHLAGLDALANGTTPVFEPQRQRKTRQQPEREVNQAVKEWARARGDITLWRNNVGAFQWAPGKWLRYGLSTGSSDFIGLRSVVVSPDMVGKRIAIFCALESKADKGVVSDEQRAFIEAVTRAGGIAGIVKDVDDCEELMKTPVKQA